MQFHSATTKLNSGWFPDFRQRIEATELLDAHDVDEKLLRSNLRDIRRVNRFFGGTSAVLKNLPQIVEHLPLDQPLRILDLGTGAADIPMSVAKWANSVGRTVSITATDISEQILQVAQEVAGHEPAISFSIEDARELRKQDRSFDLVLTSLSLHHFSRADAIKVLREMDRLSIAGFIVNDLRRSRIAFQLTRVASRFMTRNPLTRHDAPLSIRRSYTPAELEEMLDEAGISHTRVSKLPWFRMVAVQIKPT